MLSIPNRLFDESFINTFFRSPNLSIIKKDLSNNALNRNSYISQHVISVVFEGEQRIHTYDGELISARAGEMLCLKRGFYTVTDLISQGKGFLSYLIFFDDEI